MTPCVPPSGKLNAGKLRSQPELAAQRRLVDDGSGKVEVSGTGLAGGRYAQRGRLCLQMNGVAAKATQVHASTHLHTIRDTQGHTHPLPTASLYTLHLINHSQPWPLITLMAHT